ncbi:hypothetical protein [[Eubacterium] cellulosolvens]
MSKKKKIYQWSKKDKFLYLIALIPFLTAIVLASYFLSTVSFYLVIIFISFYIILNVFQACFCIGCPYRGRYCPSAFGVYLGNIFSSTFYKKKIFDLKFFKCNANLTTISLIIFLSFPVYWLTLINWQHLAIYLALIIAHIFLFFPTMCPKCSYNDICTGGQIAQKLLRI